MKAACTLHSTEFSASYYHRACGNFSGRSYYPLSLVQCLGIRCLVGLYDQAKQGRPSKCTPEQKAHIREWTKAYPKNLNKLGALVAEHFDLRMSKSTLKRMLKSMAFSWRRVRKGLKGEPDPEEYQQKKQALHDLQQQAAQGILDLYYFDESGFCFTPY